MVSGGGHVLVDVEASRNVDRSSARLAFVVGCECEAEEDVHVGHRREGKRERAEDVRGLYAGGRLYDVGGTCRPPQRDVKREHTEDVCDLGCQVKSRQTGGSGGCMRSGMSSQV